MLICAGGSTGRSEPGTFAVFIVAALLLIAAAVGLPAAAMVIAHWLGDVMMFPLVFVGLFFTIAAVINWREILRAACVRPLRKRR